MHISLNWNIYIFIERYFLHFEHFERRTNIEMNTMWCEMAQVKVHVQYICEINWIFFHSLQLMVLNHFPIPFSWRKAICMFYLRAVCILLVMTSYVLDQYYHHASKAHLNYYRQYSDFCFYFSYSENIVDYLRKMWFCMQIQYSVASALMFWCNMQCTS